MAEKKEMFSAIMDGKVQRVEEILTSHPGSIHWIGDFVCFLLYFFFFFFQKFFLSLIFFSFRMVQLPSSVLLALEM